MATSLSFLPVTGPWRDVLAGIGAYFQEHHEPHRGLPETGLVTLVDPESRRAIRTRSFALSASPSPAPEGTEQWVGFSVELWFGSGHAATVVPRVREVAPTCTLVDVWFSDELYDALRAFDDSGRSIDEDVKSDLVRLFIGAAKAIGAVGFGYQFVAEDELFGAPSEANLRGYVEGELRSHSEEVPRRIFAGLAAAEVDEREIVYYDDMPPVHRRQDGFYLYDMLWPVDSFQ